jgi:hypothetical protein
MMCKGRMIWKKITVLVVAVTVTIAMAPFTFAPGAEAKSSQIVNHVIPMNVVPVTDYGTLQTALNTKNTIAKLSNDIVISSTLQMATNNTEIDLNGHTLSSSVEGTESNKSNIIDVTAIDLSIDSSVAGGCLSLDKEYQNGIVMSSAGDLTIKDGEFYAGSASDTIIDLRGSGGSVYINDGVFDMQLGFFGQENRAIAEETNNMTRVTVSKALFKGHGPKNIIKFFAMKNNDNLTTASDSSIYYKASGESATPFLTTDKTIVEADTGNNNNNNSIAVYRTVVTANNDIYVYKGATLIYDLSSKFNNFNNSVSAKWTVNDNVLSAASPSYGITAKGFSVTAYDKGDDPAFKQANMAEIKYTGNEYFDIAGSLELTDTRYAGYVNDDAVSKKVPLSFNFCSSLPVPQNFGIKSVDTAGNEVLKWDKVDGIDEYQVEVFKESYTKIFEETVTGNVYIIPVRMLKKGTVYTCKVSGVQGTVIGDPVSVTFKTAPGDTGNPKAVMSGTNKAVITWDKAEKADGYAIGCYKNGVIYKNIDVVGNSLTITVVPGAKYSFDIMPYTEYNGGKWASTSVYVSLTVPALKVKAPSRVTIVAPSTRSRTITVKWKKVKCSGYQVYIARNSKFNKGLKKYTVPKSSTLYKKVTKLRKGTYYYVKVRAYNKSGSTKYYGKWSAVKKIKCR